MPRVAVPALVLLLGACVEEEADAVRVLLPDDVELHWDDSFNGYDDGIAAVVPVDVMVYEAETGAPLESMDLVVFTDDPGAFALHVDDVLVVDEDDCVDCALTWDAYRDRYVELVDTALDDSADEGVRLVTDVDGLARAYIYVDAFPLSDTIEPVVVRVAMGPDDEAFLLTPR